MNKAKKNHTIDGATDRLSSEDYLLYLKLNQSLLAFAAQKLNSKSNVKTREDFLKLTLEEKFNIRNSLMRKVCLIDEFAKSNPCNFTAPELEIIRSWNNKLSGTFFAVKYTHEGAIFLEEAGKNPKAYQVLALGTPFSEVISIPPPVRVEVVLLPFKGRIIYDGLIKTDNILFGSGIARSIRAFCDRAIMEHGLVKSLPFTKPTVYTDEEKLSFYLSTKESREENWAEIEEMLQKNKNLLPTYLREMGRANSRLLKKRLRNVGVKKGWFAAAGDTIVASSKTKGDLEKLVENIIPNDGKKSVFIFELK
jgi:hypothetical protein